MSKRLLISTNHNQHKQLNKLNLPYRKQSQPQLSHQLNNSYHNHNNTQSIKLQKIIYDKISHVESQNKKLLAIVNKLNQSSIMSYQQTNVSEVIYSIQEQMKIAFNQLIQSIQEFYIDIDTKIKQIGSYLATLSGIDTLETSKKDHDDFFTNNQYDKPSYIQNHPVSFNQQLLNTHQGNQKRSINQNPSHNIEQETLKSINKKIQTLQKDLQQTKSNQNKLMIIIQKLVQKYQLTNQTTIIKDDPFLKKKVQAMSSKNSQVGNKNNYAIHNPIMSKEQTYISQTSQRFMEGNTFAKNSRHPVNQVNNLNNQINNQNNFNKGSLLTSNVSNMVKNPQNIAQNQNPNDYSIYQQLNKIQTNQSPRDKKPQLSNIPPYQNPNFNKNKLKSKLIEPQFHNSSVSVNSYAYSNSINSIQQPDQQPCFIKKLYSKQTPSLNKVSLKNCNNKTIINFNTNKSTQQVIDQSNKHHRQAFLLNQLKNKHHN